MRKSIMMMMCVCEREGKAERRRETGRHSKKMRDEILGGRWIRWINGESDKPKTRGTWDKTGE